MNSSEAEKKINDIPCVFDAQVVVLENGEARLFWIEFDNASSSDLRAMADILDSVVKG